MVAGAAVGSSYYDIEAWDTLKMEGAEGLCMNRIKELKKFIIYCILYIVTIIMCVSESEAYYRIDYIILCMLGLTISLYGVIIIFLWNKFEMKTIDIMLLVLDIILLISGAFCYVFVNDSMNTIFIGIIPWIRIMKKVMSGN